MFYQDIIIYSYNFYGKQFKANISAHPEEINQHFFKF
jgi:3-methyladenine DNA glycosylase Mpg